MNSENKINVLHIVTWYPSQRNPQEAIWTKRHIDALNNHCVNKVVHIDVSQFYEKNNIIKLSDFEERIEYKSGVNRWFFKELIYTRLALKVLKREKKSFDPDVINFQIAYPLLTYFHIWKRRINIPIVVTEHWSAYHYNFGVEKELKRIKKIFGNDELKFITVSKALQRDIERFSGRKLNCAVVSNVVSEEFDCKELEREPNSFFMLSYWKEPKQPNLIFEAFSRLGMDFKLYVGGDGPLLKGMQEFARDIGIESSVSFLGRMNPVEINSRMNNVTYFVHSSNYETASVVCMEALVAGTPVIVSQVGGIPEYVDETNGVLVAENDLENWTNSLNKAIHTKFSEPKLISEQAKKRFGAESVGKKYYDVLHSLV